MIFPGPFEVSGEYYIFDSTSSRAWSCSSAELLSVHDKSHFHGDAENHSEPEQDSKHGAIFSGKIGDDQARGRIYHMI